ALPLNPSVGGDDFVKHRGPVGVAELLDLLLRAILLRDRPAAAAQHECSPEQQQGGFQSASIGVHRWLLHFRPASPAWKCVMSPSCITYSLPSRRSFPAARMADSVLCACKSASV